MTDEKRAEPSTWEVMRGIERVEKRLDTMQHAFVSVEVHRLLAEDVREVKEQATTDRAANELAVQKAKDEAAIAVTAIQTELNNAKKQRAQTWTAIGLLFAGGVAALVIDVFSRGLGLT